MSAEVINLDDYRPRSEVKVLGGEQVVRLFHPDGRCLGVRSTRTVEEATDEARAEASRYIVTI
jgi:hypothetical protein